MAANKVLMPGEPGYDPSEGDPWADTPFAKQPQFGEAGGPTSSTQSQPQQQPDQPEEPHGTPPPPAPTPTAPSPAPTANNPTDPYAPSNQQQGSLTGDQQAQAMLARLNAPGQQTNASSIVDEFNNAYGPTSKYYNDDRGETIGFPTGYLAKTPSGQWTWTQRGPEGASGGSATTPKPVDTSGLDSILQQMIQAQNAQAAQRQAYNDKIHGSVLDTINKNSQPVDANDPIITSQMAAYRGEQGRNTQLMRETLAERNAATGGTSGALESGIKSTVEDAGNKTASAEATAMTNELTQRRSALQAALSTGAGVLSADEQNNLQTTIAEINGQLGKLGIQAGQSNTAATLALQSLLGNKSLDQQNNQFYDDFGNRVANQNSNLDQILLTYLLNQGK